MITIYAFIIIILSILSFGISIYLFQKVASTLDFTKINLISLVFYSLTILAFVGSVLIGLGVDNHYMGKHIDHQKTRVMGWIMVQTVMIFLPLTMLLFKRLLKVKKKEFFNYLNSNVSNIISKEDKEVFIIISLLSFISIGSIIYTYYKIGLSNNPILNLIKGASSIELAQLRTKAGRGFSGNVYIKNIFALALTPFLSYISYIYFRIQKNKKWFTIFILLFISSILIVFYDLQKAPVLRYLITFIIINIYFGDKINLKQVLIYGFSGVIAIIIMYVFISGESLGNIFTFRSGPLNRILLSQSMSVFLHYEVFTYRGHFIGGASFPSIISENIFGLNHLRSARWIMIILRPKLVKEGIAGVYNGLFVGEAYANFGLLGVAFSIIYVGLFLYLIHVYFIRHKKNAITLALYAYLTINYEGILHGGFVDFIYSPVMLFIVLVSIAIIVSSKIMKRYLNFN